VCISPGMNGGTLKIEIVKELQFHKFVAKRARASIICSHFMRMHKKMQCHDTRFRHEYFALEPTKYSLDAHI
jgi:hypothetical protein